MFETLDTTPWHRLKHSYGNASDVPNNLRLMLSPDQQEFEQGLGQLWNSVNHQGDINSSSPYVVPFMLEMLAEPNYLHKWEVLEYLITQVECARGYIAGRAIGDRWFKYAMCLYERVSDGIRIYIRLLSYSEIKVRFLSAKLLGELVDHAACIRIALRRAVQHEESEYVRAQMWWSLAQAMPHELELRRRRNNLFREYLKIFAEVIEKAAFPVEKLGAAAAWVKTVSNGNPHKHWTDLPLNLIPILVDALTYSRVVHEQLEISFGGLILTLLTSLGSPALADSLTIVGITPDVAHNIGRELLDKLFERRLLGYQSYPSVLPEVYVKWRGYQSWLASKKFEKRIYSHHGSELNVRRYRVGTLRRTPLSRQ